MRSLLSSSKRSVFFLLAVLIAFSGLLASPSSAQASPRSVSAVSEVSTTVSAQVPGLSQVQLSLLPAGYSPILPADRNSIDPVVNIGRGDSTVSYLVAQANDVAGFPMLTYTSSDGLLSFNAQGYSQLEPTKKQTVMKATLDGIKTSDLSPQRKNTMYNFVADQDGSVTKAIRILSTDAHADLSRAGAAVKVFSTPLGVFMGLLVISIFILLTLSTAIDLFFITLPPFRAFVMKDSKSKPFYVSTEAYHAMKVSEESVGTGSYKGATGVYFRLRFWVFIIVPVLLILLVTGQIWSILLNFVPVLNW